MTIFASNITVIQRYLVRAVFGQYIYNTGARRILSRMHTPCSRRCFLRYSSPSQVIGRPRSVCSSSLSRRVSLFRSAFLLPGAVMGNRITSLKNPDRSLQVSYAH